MKILPADALRAAINVLRDSAETRLMPNGSPLDDAGVQLHFDAADELEHQLAALREIVERGRFAP